MADCGLIFAINEEDIQKLRTFNSDIEKLQYIQEELEEQYFDNYPNQIAELDTAWETIHRTLSDGTLREDVGTYPLNHVILGGEDICKDKQDIYIFYKNEKHVNRICHALLELSDKTLHKGFFQIKADDYEYEINEEEFEFMIDWYKGLVELYQYAQKHNKAVLFVAY